jgi:Holliday junction resolvasome RuvABC endonuclease subunit
MNLTESSGVLEPYASQTSLFVFTYSANTIFDGVTGTGDAKFVSGAPVAVRALYLDNTQPTFAAAKVR